MLGVGKNKGKSNKSKKSRDDSMDYSQPRLEIVDSKSEMPQNKFELYFRVYLLVKYYYGLFADINT